MATVETVVKAVEKIAAGDAVPWDKIKLDFLKGCSTRFLAKRYGVVLGTITSRIYREGWGAQREKLLAAAEKAVQANATKLSAQSHANAFVDRVKRQVDVGLDILEQNPPEIGSLERHGRTLEVFARVGRTAHKLDETGIKGVLIPLDMLKQEPAIDAEFEPIPSSSGPAKLALSEGEPTD